MLKSKRLAYDGRGNAVVRSEADVDTAVASLGGDWTNLYAEQWVEYTRELSVLVARSRTGNTQVYPVVETVQQASICHTVIMPAQVSGDVLRHAQTVAERAVSAYDGAGIFAVELFLLADKRVLYNETAPRPHNSGHVTIEACHTDQFEQHLRCVAGLPFGAPGMRCPVAAMVNLLGSGSTDEDLAKTYVHVPPSSVCRMCLCFALLKLVFDYLCFALLKLVICFFYCFICALRCSNL